MVADSVPTQILILLGKLVSADFRVDQIFFDTFRQSPQKRIFCSYAKTIYYHHVKRQCFHSRRAEFTSRPNIQNKFLSSPIVFCVRTWKVVSVDPGNARMHCANRTGCTEWHLMTSNKHAWAHPLCMNVRRFHARKQIKRDSTNWASTPVQSRWYHSLTDWYQ